MVHSTLLHQGPESGVIEVVDVAYDVSYGLRRTVSPARLSRSSSADTKAGRCRATYNQLAANSDNPSS
jgi:hypothetical protein